MTKTILFIPADIEIKTGLHIWGSDQEFEIGWIDTPVIMKPILVKKDNVEEVNWQENESKEEILFEPYIPWSSIKWRMRALLEMYEYGIGGRVSNYFEQDDKWIKKVSINWKEIMIDKTWLIQDEEHEISNLFWASGKVKKNNNNESFHIPWTLIVKDFVLQNDYFKKYKNWELILEEKMENTVPRFIDKNTNPRRIQRVPAGTRFVGLFVIIGEEEQQNWQDTNNEITLEQKFELFKKWIKYIQQTYLWWSWTRGYGSVGFNFYKSQNKNIEEILQAVYDSRDLSRFWEAFSIDNVNIDDFKISTKSNDSETIS